ncbi:MAG: carboxypeptidase-like regulatory domain-containing protein [Putridiphycobacter sp.]|nr:carboxypeptidase-like regulatory domain-containing protein [Putridiphycobacter sp.]
MKELHMNIKSIFFLLISFLTITSFSQKSYKIEYILVLEGRVIDKDSVPVPNAEITTHFKYALNANSPTTVTKTKTDSLGNYEVRLQKNGLYEIEFGGDKFISYHVKCHYKKELAEQMRKREYHFPLQVQLQPVTKKIKNDIYNGAELFFRGGEVILTPYNRYLQAYDYELRKGFKTAEKLAKYTAKQINKQQMLKILSVVASRSEIDSIITSNKFTYEVKDRWHVYFGKTYPEMDQKRLEYIQDFYTKISAKNEEGELIYTYQSHKLNLTKTVMADDTKTVFNLYVFTFADKQNNLLSFDMMLMNTENGWKINYISENYN